VRPSPGATPRDHSAIWIGRMTASTWGPQGSSVRGVHTESTSVWQLPTEILYSGSLKGSGEATKGARNPLDPPARGALASTSFWCSLRMKA
jgi:hypothetical protein